MAAATAAAIGLGAASAYGSKRASDRAGKYDEASEAATAQQARLTGVQADFAEELLDRYRKIYGPLEEKFAKAGQAGLNKGYLADRAQADVVQAYDRAEDITERNLARYGSTPDSGSYQAGLRDLRLGEAKDVAGARTNARLGAEDVEYSRMRDLVNIGRGAAEGGIASLRSATAGYGDIASQNAARAGRYGGAAGGLGEAAGGFFTEAFKSYGGG